MKSEFWANGWDDFTAGQSVNPYPAMTAAFHDWNEGYSDAADDAFYGQEVFDEEDDDGDYPADQYWSGTGELMSDDSYIDYLNNS